MNNSKLGILPDLTKKYILDRVSQEDIMYFYTNIKVTDETLTGNSFLSPLRPDNNPTCNYYYTSYNKLKLRDFALGFNGDIFDVISYKTKINTTTSQGFVLLLHKIARDLHLHKYNNENERKLLDSTVDEFTNKKQLKVFKIVPRAFNYTDNNYWTKQYGITKDMLREAKIIPVQELYITDNFQGIYKRYNYHSSNPAYAYYGGNEEGINIWKIYFPLSKDKRYKFLSNKSFLQGYHLLKPAEFCVITKSYKDVLCYKSFGVQSISLASETTILTSEQAFDIKSLFNITVSNMDYDRAGILMANKLKNKYNITPLMFTTGKKGQLNYGVKDFSDFISVYGRDKAKVLLYDLIQDYREQLNTINTYNYEALSWIQK